jgi:hypothetical protein
LRLHLLSLHRRLLNLDLRNDWVVLAGKVAVGAAIAIFRVIGVDHPRVRRAKLIDDILVDGVIWVA